MTITRCVPVQAGSQVISVIRRLVGRCRGWPGTGSSTAVSGIIIAFTIPAILFAAIAGVFVEARPQATVEAHADGNPLLVHHANELPVPGQKYLHEKG